MIVARLFRRNRKITATTRAMVISRVISTSFTEARMVWVRSDSTCTLIEGGMLASSRGRASLIRFTVSMTLAPGCLRTNSRIAWPLGSEASG